MNVTRARYFRCGEIQNRESGLLMRRAILLLPAGVMYARNRQ